MGLGFVGKGILKGGRQAVAAGVERWAARSANRGQRGFDFSRSRKTPSGVSGELPTAQVGWAASSNYASTFRAANPNAGDVWVHHAIEQQVLKRYPGLFRPEEIHSLENLRGIPSGIANNQIHLSEIRKMWNSFYRANPSPIRQDVLDSATKIDRKLGVFFDPPVL